MKHIHLFQHTGGGCSNNGTSYLCDDSYECECGAKFRTMSDMETHFVMPSYIAGKDEPEVAKVETHLREDLNLIKNEICFPRAQKFDWKEAVAWIGFAAILFLGVAWLIIDSVPAK